MSRSTRVLSGAGQVSRTPIKRLTIAPVRRVGLVLICIMALLWMIDRVGFLAHGNGHLRYLYYQMRGAERLPERVVLVAMDEQTGEVWGPPPWSWQRYETMLSTILAAKPTAVGVLEPGPRVLSTEQASLSAVITGALASGQLVLPPLNPGLGQPRLDMRVTQHGIEAVELDAPAGGISVTKQLIQAAGLTAPDGERLWVHYLGGPNSLPTVPAHRVLTGEIPSDTFRDRIVVIGLRGEQFAPAVPTPVGAMSPAEVHAYALRGLAEGAVWRIMPGWVQWLLCTFMALLCLLTLPRLSLRSTSILILGLCITTLIADFALFSLSIVRLGAAAPVTAVILAAIVTWLGERHRAHQELVELARWTAKQASAAAPAGQQTAATNSELWNRFARASRTYSRFASTLLGELPEGTWHLRFELTLDTEPDQIGELRRDIRREPYKSVYVSHRPVWSDRYMKRELGLKTLLVPLMSFNRILGLWVLNFPKDAQVERPTLRLIEMLAEQISSTMERQRMRRIFGVRSSGREGLLARPIQETRSTLQSYSQEQNNLSQIFDSLPVGVLVATLWGEIEYVNAPMRRFLASVNMDNLQQRGLPEVLTTLTDASENDVHETVMHLVSGKPSVELSCNSHAGLDASYQLVLSSLSQASLFAESKEGGDEASMLSHFVLTVTRRVSKGSQSVPKSALSSGIGQG